MPDGDSRTAVLVAHLQRLDREALAALVADLWAARGYETAREGDVVVADRDGEREVVAPVAGSRVPLVGPTVPDRGVDVVVAPGGAPAGLTEDAEVVDGQGLARLLRYAVPTAAGRQLCQRHLGAPPAALDPPLGARLRERVAGAGSATERRAPSTRRAATVLAAVALLWAGAVAALSGGVWYRSGPASGAGVAGSATPTVTPSTPGRTPVENAAAVPGVNASGIENLTALANAHGQVLSGTSFTVWIDVYRPRAGDPRNDRVQRDIDLHVEGDRYLATTTIEGPDGRRRTRSVYHDGDGTFLANWSDGNASIRRLGPEERPLPLFGDPAVFRREMVERYLRVRSSRVTASVVEDGRTLFRIEGSGLARPARSISGYEVAVMVDRRGLVHELVAEFRLRAANGSYPVRVEFTYDDVGTTAVTPPSWYRRAFPDNGAVASVGEPGADAPGAAARAGIGALVGRVARATPAGIGSPWSGDGSSSTGVARLLARPRAAPAERELLFSSRRYR